MSSLSKAQLEKLEEELTSIFEAEKDRIHAQIKKRMEKVRKEIPEYYEIMELYGFGKDDCMELDVYHNTSRLTFRSLGKLLEDLTTTVFSHTKGGNPLTLNNPNPPPTTFYIDWVIPNENRVYEIKWRDATTDGDHVRKEEAKISAISSSGYKPIRVMYYRPTRAQAKAICDRVTALYEKHGEAYIGKDAWNHIKIYTGFDLRNFVFNKLKRKTTSPLF